MTVRPFILSAIAAASAVVAAPLALRGANTMNSVASNVYVSGNDDRTDNIYRVPLCVGSCDWTDIRASSFNWIFEQLGISFDGGTDFTIQGLAIEMNGTYRPVTWGGASSKIVINGTTDIHSDPLYPADFGFSGGVIPRGTTGFWRILLRADAATKWPACPLAQVTGARLRYNPTEVTITPGVYGVGDFEPTDWGLVSWAGAPPFVPVLIGTPAVTDGKFGGAVGDSITAGEGETSTTNGGGFARASYSDYSTKANPISCINFGLPSTTLLAWIGNGENPPTPSANATNIALPEAYLKYCNIIFEQYGTNGIYQSHVTKLWEVIKRGSPGCKLARSSLFPRTPTPPSGTSDLWATTAGQSPTQAPGGEVDMFEQWCQDQVGLGQVDYYINYDSCRANTDRTSVDYYKWAVNGVANYATADGLHPTTAIYDLMYGGEARALIDSVTVS